MSASNTRPATVPVSSQLPAAGAAAPTPLKSLCSSCNLRELCLPCGMDGLDVERLDSLVFARRAVEPSKPACRWPMAASRSAASTWAAS